MCSLPLLRSPLSEAGVKDVDNRLNLVIDDDDALRNELEIPKDFLFLGGRQSYVVDASGTIVQVHNNQFDTDSPSH